MTVTTVLYNSEATLGRYAAALSPLLRTGFVRLVAVDNASPDASSTVLASLLPTAEVKRNVRNAGFAAGCNFAWPSVATRYWLLLNPDVDVTSLGVRTLVQWMDDHPEVGVATPRLRGVLGEALPVARAHDAVWRPLVELLRLHKLVPEPRRSLWLLSGARFTPETIDGWIPGAALIARSQAVVDVGLLNEDLFLYGEDREWCWRMARAGWAVGVCPTVEFVHIGGTSAEATWDQDELTRREVFGHLKVTRAIRGPAWARAFALSVGISLLAASVDIRRAKSVRTDARLRGRLYVRAACSSVER